MQSLFFIDTYSVVMQTMVSRYMKGSQSVHEGQSVGRRAGVSYREKGGFSVGNFRQVAATVFYKVFR